jgi:hypothetical protein
MSTYSGSISGRGHHIGDHGVVHNMVTDLAAAVAELDRQVDAHRDHLSDRPGVADAVRDLVREVELADPDRTRLQILVTRIRAGAAGVAAVVGVADQIARIVGAG